MTIKLNDLSGWRELPADKALVLRGNGGGARHIELRVNTDYPMRFTALEHGVEYFLAVVNGTETIQFAAEGEVEVAAEGEGVVWYKFDDGDVHAYQHSEGYRLFVKPMTEESRSPEMEALAEKLEERHQRKLQLQRDANEQLFEQLAAERAQRVTLEREKLALDAAAAAERAQRAAERASAAADAASGGGGGEGGAGADSKAG